MGQRIVFFRPLNDPKKARQQALMNSGREKEIREKSHAIVLRLINTVLKTQERAIEFSLSWSP